MLEPHLFVALCERVGFTPVLDVCADRMGANALAPHFYSVEENSLKQDLSGRSFVCNPPYCDLGPWIAKCEQAKLLDAATKVLLIIPLRDSADYQ